MRIIDLVYLIVALVHAGFFGFLSVAWYLNYRYGATKVRPRGTRLWDIVRYEDQVSIRDVEQLSPRADRMIQVGEFIEEADRKVGLVITAIQLAKCCASFGAFTIIWLVARSVTW